MDLRGRLIRLAFERPDLRETLLPLMEKKGSVGLSGDFLTELVQRQARRSRVDPNRVSVTTQVVRAGTLWTAAVARTLGVWQQTHPDATIRELMVEAPEVAFRYLSKDDTAFKTWASEFYEDHDLVALGTLFKKSLGHNHRKLLSAAAAAVRST